MGNAVTLHSPPPRNLYLRAWIPSLLWVVVIAVESTSLGSSEHTAALISWLLTAVFPHISAARLALANHLMRKCGHFAGYGLLSVLFLRTWWAMLWLRRRPHAAGLPGWGSLLSAWREGAVALAVASTAIIASLDEWHQSFLPGRTGTWRDVVLDTMAAIFVQAVILVCSDLRVRVPGPQQRMVGSASNRD